MLSQRHIQRNLALSAAFLAACAPVSGQVGLGLSPMRQEWSLSPGAQHSGVLNLANDGGTHTRVVPEILDFYLDENNQPQFKKSVPEEAKHSCRQWLTVNPMELELRGNDHVPVRYTVRTPRTVPEGSYHCAVGFTTQPTASQLTGTGLRNAVQIVSAFYVVIGKPSIQGAVKNIKLEWKADPKEPGWRATVVLANTGLMHYRPAGLLQVLDTGGAVVESRDFAPMPVLPEREQNFIFPLEMKGGPGSYTLRARVDLGGNEIQEASALVVAQIPAPKN